MFNDTQISKAKAGEDADQDVVRKVINSGAAGRNSFGLVLDSPLFWFAFTFTFDGLGTSGIGGRL